MMPAGYCGLTAWSKANTNSVDALPVRDAISIFDCYAATDLGRRALLSDQNYLIKSCARLAPRPGATPDHFE